MLEIDNCTGCAACMNKCPVNAIQMQIAEDGFYHPVIDREKCVKCMQCEKVCPLQYVDTGGNLNKVYAVKHKSDDVRMNSSSGGVFTALSMCILQQGGIVVGAHLNEMFKVEHIVVNNPDDLALLRGSKYPQSDIGLVYREVKGYLATNKKVLFTGTPCQIAGLNKFLGKEYDNLVTCDIICHGVMSPEIFHRLITIINKRNNVHKVSFRIKNYGWSKQIWGVFSKERIICKSLLKKFKRLYTRGYSINKSCFSCKYANKNRLSDITIGDAWKLLYEQDVFVDEKGVSSVWVHTKKGAMLFELAQTYLEIKTCNFDNIDQPQLNHPTPIPELYHSFWQFYFQKGLHQALNKYGASDLIRRGFSLLLMKFSKGGGVK